MLPLAHRRILITRAQGQASALAAELAELGAEPIVIPAIEIAPPTDDFPLRQAMADLDRFDWIVFTSANAVEVFAERLEPTRPHPKIAVIGSATARAVEQHGLSVALMPAKFVAESLAAALAPHANGSKILLLRAAVARDILPETLAAMGAAVTIVEAYRTVVPAESVEALSRLLAEPATYPHAATFTSASTANNLASLLREAGLQLPKQIVRASIGPITSRAMLDLGWAPTVEARESTVPSLVEALVEYYGARC